MLCDLYCDDELGDIKFIDKDKLKKMWKSVFPVLDKEYPVKITIKNISDPDLNDNDRESK